MDYDQIFEGADPEELASRLRWEIVHWHDGILYVRDENDLYSIHPDTPSPNNANSTKLSMHVRKDDGYHGYVGEIYHTPSEGAVHAGLTVTEGAGTDKDVTALDGFGRKYRVYKTGNGPMASGTGEWASEEEMKQWRPQHSPAKKTET